MFCVDESLNWKYQYATRVFDSGIHRSLRSSMILELNLVRHFDSKVCRRIHTLAQFFHNQLKRVSIMSDDLVRINSPTPCNQIRPPLSNHVWYAEPRMNHSPVSCTRQSRVVSWMFESFSEGHNHSSISLLSFSYACVSSSTFQGFL